MLLVVLNAFLYLGLLSLLWKRTKLFNERLLLVFVWFFVSVACAVLYFFDPQEWKLLFWPFLYLIVIFILFIRYLFKRGAVSFPIEVFIEQRSPVLDLINTLYIFCAIYEIANIDLAVLSFSYLSEEAAELYKSAHEDTEISKGFLFYCQRFTSAFFILSVLSVFNYLAQGRKIIGTFLFACIFVSTMAGNAAIASRGAMFSQLLVFVVVFLIYKDHLPITIKKVIYRLGTLVGVFVTLFFVAITISRFTGLSGEYERGPFYSVISYFGHSMLSFDYGVCDTISGHWNGQYTFNYLFSRLGLFSGYNDLGTHFGSGFITFIGILVLDFGFIGTLVVSLVFPLVIFKMWSGKNSRSFAGLYIYVFYINRMLMGVFVSSPGADYLYAWAFLIYFLLRIALKPSQNRTKIYFVKRKYHSFASNPELNA